MGLEVRLIPLFELEPVQWSAPDSAEFDAILLTSANALRLAGEQLDRLRRLPVLCVGEATARAACVAGFGVAAVGEGGVDELLASTEPGARLLHLCGADRRPPQHPKQSITCVTVYRAKPLPQPEGLEELEGQVAAVHSPRAAKRLAELVAPPIKPTICVAAISEAAAEAAGAGWESLEVASAPSDEALLALASRLCQN
jgi:uroporphyrinogen-III synthase